jgi:hypothetical protein
MIAADEHAPKMNPFEAVGEADAISFERLPHSHAEGGGRPTPIRRLPRHGHLGRIGLAGPALDWLADGRFRRLESGLLGVRRSTDEEQRGEQRYDRAAAKP